MVFGIILKNTSFSFHRAELVDEVVALGALVSGLGLSLYAATLNRRELDRCLCLVAGCMKKNSVL